MSGNETLNRLAALAGIEDGWWDFFGTWRVVSPETKRAFLAAMGLAVANEAEIAASLTDLKTRSWRRWLEPVTVLGEEMPAAVLTVTLPAMLDKLTFTWVLEEELGVTHSGSFQADTLAWQEELSLDGVLVKRWRLALPEMPPLGYHRFHLTGPGGSASAVVAVAPARAHVPEVLEGERKIWGIATQIYALREPTDWGIGTYKALERLAAGAKGLGAATVGVNPLHALFPNQPEKFSPYAPSSRRFLNTAYIDIEALPEFPACREAKRLFAAPGFQAALSRVRSAKLIDYEDAARLARPVLDALYRHFRQEHLDPEDDTGRAFRAFQREGGEPARLFCTFEALQEEQMKEGRGYWRHWPDAVGHPSAAGVEAFGREKAERVEFFWWLQFIADRQLQDAHRAGCGNGGIGLYRDLGVGIAGDGAEAWLEQDNLALGVSVGAPPDPLALKGQDWGLVPFNPLALHDAAYAPFIGVMRANMRHAGALRLDHAMALQRLYWVPAGAAADQGAYVRYPVDDLFRLVALESRRNHCLVIGEDLGTVPDGFRERMAAMALFAYRVMVFEKDSPTHYRPPQAFEPQALAIFATHDLPSLRGWWHGIDIDQREALDLYPRPGMAGEERDARHQDRMSMVAAMAEHGLLSPDFPPQGPLSDAQTEVLAAAAHAYLDRSRSRLMMVQIEDVLGMEIQMNLPGTTVEHPNWRRRFPVDVATLLAGEALRGLAGRMRGRG